MEQTEFEYSIDWLMLDHLVGVPITELIKTLESIRNRARKQKVKNICVRIRVRRFGEEKEQLPPKTWSRLIVFGEKRKRRAKNAH